MQVIRRQAVLGGASALLLPGAATPPPPVGAARLMRIFHVRGTPDKGSQTVEVHVAPASKPLPIVSVVARSMKADVEDWHNAPFKSFTINTAGRIRTTMSDGSNQHIGPGDLV